MANAPRYRAFRFRDLSDAARQLGELARDVVDAFNAQPKWALKEMAYAEGNTISVSVGFRPDVVLVAKVLNENGSQATGGAAVPTWTAEKTGFEVTAIAGLTSPANYTVTFLAGQF